MRRLNIPKACRLLSGTFLFLFCISMVSTAQVNYSEMLSGAEYNVGYKLEWMTSSEENTKHFVVERSMDGKNYTAIGTVEAKGSLDEENKYSFMDQELGLKDAHYRLKEVTFDGTTSLSSPIALTKEIQANFMVSYVAEEISTGLFEIVINSIVEEEMTCMVNNAEGDIIQKETRWLSYGLNDLVFDLQNEEEGKFNILFKVGREFETLSVEKVDDEEKKKNVAVKKSGSGG